VSLHISLYTVTCNGRKNKDLSHLVLKKEREQSIPKYQTMQKFGSKN
jgi:hypothetical protein